MELKVRNANDLFSEGLWKFKVMGVEANSRNGPVIRIEEPVMITVERPQERVLFNGERDANPIFHLLEACWILSGRRDVAFLQQFNSKIGQYSDDGEVFNAPYGWRMRSHFGFDQLKSVIHILAKDPDSRQAVIQLWDSEDLDKKTKDKCCNTQLIFSIVHGRVHLTINCRSNDFWYGNSGANIVHFSFLLEFVASALDRPIGKMHTLINNLHLYTELYDAQKHVESPPHSDTYDAYQQGVQPRNIMESSNWQRWLIDCEHFCANPFDLGRGYYDSFFAEVARPMALVSKTRKDKTGDGMYWAARIEAQDWRLATEDWIERRENQKQYKQLELPL